MVSFDLIKQKEPSERLCIGDPNQRRLQNRRAHDHVGNFNWNFIIPLDVDLTYNRRRISAICKSPENENEYQFISNGHNDCDDGITDLTAIINGCKVSFDIERNEFNVAYNTLITEKPINCDDIDSFNMNQDDINELSVDMEYFGPTGAWNERYNLLAEYAQNLEDCQGSDGWLTYHNENEYVSPFDDESAADDIDFYYSYPQFGEEWIHFQM